MIINSNLEVRLFLGSLKFFSHAEGYVDAENGNKYVYQYKDHLGNVRLSYLNIGTTTSPNLEIQEENNYYPFGLQHKGYNNVVNGTENNYQTFQGKEEEKELGRNTYDFGWRAFDPAIARWTNIDPMAERYLKTSTYVFTANSPIYILKSTEDILKVRMKRELKDSKDKQKRELQNSIKELTNWKLKVKTLEI